MKAKKIKRTHTFDPNLLDRLEMAAQHERRPVSEQLAIFLEESLENYERKKAKDKEDTSGQYLPELMTA
jgi:hypothetical protein